MLIKKKLLLKIMALTLVLGCLFVFASCDANKPQTDGDNKNVTVIVVDNQKTETTYSVKTKAVYLENVLEEMKENELKSEDNVFSFKSEDGSYGAYIVEVLGYTASGNEYWGVYSNLIENAYEEYYVEIKEKKYYSTAVGVSSYEISDGETIVLYLSTF